MAHYFIMNPADPNRFVEIKAMTHECLWHVCKGCLDKIMVKAQDYGYAVYCPQFREQFRLERKAMDCGWEDGERADALQIALEDALAHSLKFELYFSDEDWEEQKRLRNIAENKED
jgi:hypothetical protein